MLKFSLANQEPLNITVKKITMANYDKHHYDKEQLVKSGTDIGSIVVNPIADLQQVRAIIDKLVTESMDSKQPVPEWCFIDCKFESS